MATKKSVSLSVGRGEKLPVSKGAGLTAKGRAKYNAATGSNLKAPAPNPQTKADEGRKKSFCSRMSIKKNLNILIGGFTLRNRKKTRTFPHSDETN